MTEDEMLKYIAWNLAMCDMESGKDIDYAHLDDAKAMADKWFLEFEGPRRFERAKEI